MTPQTVQNWLKFGSLMTMGFGIVLALSAIPITAGPALLLTDVMLWPLDGAQQLASLEAKILAVILGGVMSGWGVAFWLLATRLYPREPELAATIIKWSIWTWFVLDSTGSILVGVPLNALLNTGFLFVFVFPLWRAKSATA